MWREMTAIAVLAAAFFVMLWLATGAERARESLTVEREAFLRERIGYLEAQVRLERAACAQERARKAVDGIRFTVFGKLAEVVEACDPRRYGSVMPCAMSEKDWTELSRRWRLSPATNRPALQVNDKRSEG